MKRSVQSVFLLLLLLGLAGCSLRRQENTAREEDTSQDYIIYYVNAAGDGLTGKKYTPQETNFEGILKELLYAFENPTDTSLVSAKPANVTIQGYTMGVDNLTMDFNAEYLAMTNVQEILLRAALVRTLVRLPGIVNVSVTVDGQTLTEDDGSPVGPMNEETFIDTGGSGINSYHYVTLELFFPQKNGKKLERETRSVFYSSNLILEKVIAEEIISGPKDQNSYLRVTGTEASVKNIWIDGDICTLDLDEDFNKTYDEAVDPEIALYSFVNSICEICDVKGVQFEIEGNVDIRFRDEVNLGQIFEYNPDVIAEDDSQQPSSEKETSQTEQDSVAPADSSSADGEQPDASGDPGADVQPENDAADNDSPGDEDSGDTSAADGTQAGGIGETASGSDPASQAQDNESIPGADTAVQTAVDSGEGVVGIDPALGGG